MTEFKPIGKVIKKEVAEDIKHRMSKRYLDIYATSDENRRKELGIALEEFLRNSVILAGQRLIISDDTKLIFQVIDGLAESMADHPLSDEWLPDDLEF